jgi:hypothetical protein
MNFKILSLGAICLLTITITKGQTLSPNWKQDLASSLQQFLECQSSEAEKNINCTTFAGQAVNTVYKVNDFYSKQSGRYMSTTEIAGFLKENNSWSNLGKTYDQKTLDKAQEYANARKAVIAIYQNAQGFGHVVVITPGELQPSGSWGLKVPNVASFFAVDPAKSFTDKPLSFAFSKNMIKDVVIYGRNY